MFAMFQLWLQSYNIRYELPILLLLFLKVVKMLGLSRVVYDFFKQKAALLEHNIVVLLKIH